MIFFGLLKIFEKTVGGIDIHFVGFTNNNIMFGSFFGAKMGDNFFDLVNRNNGLTLKRGDDCGIFEIDWRIVGDDKNRAAGFAGDIWKVGKVVKEHFRILSAVRQ